MFADIGFSYQSTFFNSNPFTKLIVPFNSKDFNLSSTSINSRLFTSNTIEYVNPPATTTKIINPGISTIVTDFEDVTMSNDFGSPLFNTATGTYTCNQTGQTVG